MLIVLSRTIFSRLLIPSDFIHDLFSASLWHWTGLIITFLIDLFLLLMSLTLPGFLGYLATDLVSCLPAVIFFFCCVLPAIHTTISLHVQSVPIQFSPFMITAAFIASCKWFPALQLCSSTAPKLQPHLLNWLLDIIICMSHSSF